MPVDVAAAALPARAERAAQHRYHPRVLWPGIDLHAFEHAGRDIVGTVQDVLAGRPAASLCAEPRDAALYGRAAFRLGVGPLLGWWMSTGQVTAQPDVVALFETHLENGRLRQARLAGEAAGLLRALRADGVEPVLLKGLDSAAFYPAPGTRTFQDIDLYVAPAQAGRAEHVLSRLGFAPGPLREGRRRDWHAPGTVFRSLEYTHAENPWGVDLHFGLGRNFHRVLAGELPHPDVPACPFARLEHTEVRVLPPALRLALLALNASSNLRLLQVTHLLDLVFAARAADRPGDTLWTEVTALLRRSGSTRFAYPGLMLAERLVPGTVPAGALEDIASVVTRRMRRITADLPLTGLSEADRWRATRKMLFVATPGDAMRVLWRVLSDPWR